VWGGGKNRNQGGPGGAGKKQTAVGLLPVFFGAEGIMQPAGPPVWQPGGGGGGWLGPAAGLGSGPGAWGAGEGTGGGGGETPFLGDPPRGGPGGCFCPFQNPRVTGPKTAGGAGTHIFFAKKKRGPKKKNTTNLWAVGGDPRDGTTENPRFRDGTMGGPPQKKLGGGENKKKKKKKILSIYGTSCFELPVNGGNKKILPGRAGGFSFCQKKGPGLENYELKKKKNGNRGEKGLGEPGGEKTFPPGQNPPHGKKIWERVCNIFPPGGPGGGGGGGKGLRKKGLSKFRGGGGGGGGGGGPRSFLNKKKQKNTPATFCGGGGGKTIFFPPGKKKREGGPKKFNFLGAPPKTWKRFFRGGPFCLCGGAILAPSGALALYFWAKGGKGFFVF